MYKNVYLDNFAHPGLVDLSRVYKQTQKWELVNKFLIFVDAGNRAVRI